MPKEVMISHGLLVSLVSIRIVVKPSCSIVGADMIGYTAGSTDKTSYNKCDRITSVVR